MFRLGVLGDEAEPIGRLTTNSVYSFFSLESKLAPVSLDHDVVAQKTIQAGSLAGRLFKVGVERFLLIAASFDTTFSRSKGVFLDSVEAASS